MLFFWILAGTLAYTRAEQAGAAVVEGPVPAGAARTAVAASAA